MALDNLAMYAGEGGVVPCPYPVDEDGGSISDGDFAGSIHSNDEISSSASSMVGDTPRVVDVTEAEEHEDTQAGDDKSDIKWQVPNHLLGKNVTDFQMAAFVLRTAWTM